MRLKKEPFQGQLTEEQRAFLNQIYIAMYSTIYHYAIAAVQNKHLAQEIAQIVFTKACNDPESIMAVPDIRLKAAAFADRILDPEL